MPANPGQIPPEARRKRVHVQLHGGYSTTIPEPQGWPADGLGACNWTLSSPPHPFEMKRYRVI
jgi:hypothetical protein